jgi:hypothetical protein
MVFCAILIAEEHIGRTGVDRMTVNLSINSHCNQVASGAELERALMPFASEQFREICVDMDQGGPALIALLNGNIGWLMYLRHDEGDTGFSSRNLAFEGSDAAPGGPAFVSRFNGKLVPVIEYRLGNGQVDEYPASWALPEQEIMRALEYFVEHQGGRAPFVHWHDDATR